MKFNTQSRAMRGLACLLASAGIALTACGTSTIDAADLENELAEQIAPQGGVQPEDVSVDCPSDEESEKGNRFSCTLTAPNGDEVPVDVEITNDDGGFEAQVAPQAA